MQIQYKNEKGETINAEQTGSLNEFYKCFSADGQLIKMEIYLDGQLYGYTYYNPENLPHPVLLAQYYPKDRSDLEFCIIDAIHYQNGWQLETLHSYDDAQGKLLGKTFSVFDSDNELIGHEVQLLEQGTWQQVYHRKYYYDRAINPQSELCSFSYAAETGELVGFSISDPRNFGDSFYSNSEAAIQDLIERTGISKELLMYYLVGKVIPD